MKTLPTKKPAFYILFMAFTLLFVHCSKGDDTKDPNAQQVLGCTNPNATNYNENATDDDGSCNLPDQSGIDAPEPNFSFSASESSMENFDTNLLEFEFDGVTYIFNSSIINFTNTTDIGDNPENQVSYSWDFGDDSGPSTEVNASHSYSLEGDYEVTLTATGVDNSGSVTKTMRIRYRRVVQSVTVDAAPELKDTAFNITWDNGEPNDETGPGLDLSVMIRNFEDDNLPRFVSGDVYEDIATEDYPQECDSFYAFFQPDLDNTPFLTPTNDWYAFVFDVDYGDLSEEYNISNDYDIFALPMLEVYKDSMSSLRLKTEDGIIDMTINFGPAGEF